MHLPSPCIHHHDASIFMMHPSSKCIHSHDASSIMMHPKLDACDESFYFISDKEFVDFHSFHTRSISYLVIPLMIIEASTSIMICFFYYGLIPLINLILVFSIWIVTFLLQVPCHNKLSCGKSDTIIKKLIDTNIIRVYLWFFKTISILLIIL